MQKARWSTAVAAATLLALPIAAFAQSTTTQKQQPQTQSAQVDPAAAKTHLSQARDTLSQLTAMPEAAKLQGDARTQVSQLISNFNALITTQSDWRPAYAKVDENLMAVLGPDAPPDQPVGTSGTTAALDPAIRAKLTEFRTHLRAFEAAAGGAASGSGAMPPAAPTPTTTNPSNPTSPANPANPSNPPGAAGVSSSSPTATMEPEAAKAASEVNAAANATAQKALDAISAILSKSRTGALTKAQTTELKKHVDTLRAALLVQR
jgi:hypothetical protein